MNHPKYASMSYKSNGSPSDLQHTKIEIAHGTQTPNKDIFYTFSFWLLYLYFQMRSFMFAAGFSLAFGSMFTKTYRVHQIFTRAHSGLIKSKVGFVMKIIIRQLLLPISKI